MDGLDLFRKLGFGAKFNFNRFHKDAESLHLKRQKQKSHFGSNNNNDNVPTVDELHRLQAPPIKKRKTSEDPEATPQEEVVLLGAIKSLGKEDNVFKNVPGKKNHKAKKKSELEINAEVKQEKVNHFRNKNKIHVYGTDIPDPILTFDDLRSRFGLAQAVISNVKSAGFVEPTPIQMQAVPVMMQGREILACAPTGSGKTLGFILPILHQLKGPQNKGFRGLVLSPTRELAMQTYRELVKISEGVGFRIHVIDKVDKAAKKFGPKSSKKFDILVTTPNRLVYMLSQDPPMISLNNVEWLVVDESDKLFEEGKTGFRDQLATIYRACDGKNVRRAMFSATFAHDVEEWCKLNLDNVIQVYVGERNAATETVDQELLFVGSESGKLIAVRNLIKKGIQPPILVFVQSKDRAKELFHELAYDGINVDVIHADRTQIQRDNIVKQFRAGHIWVLICTELMGRGIDFKGINLVINFDFPNSAISYIHRIGRTGRAGRKGKAITFFTEEDVTNLRTIANVLRGAGCEVPEYMLRLKKLDKKNRRKLAKSAVKRKTIRTFPKTDIQKAHEKRVKHTKTKNPSVKKTAKNKK